MKGQRSPFPELIAALENFNPELVVVQAAKRKDIKEVIIELNRDDQLYEQGIRSDGRSLPDYDKNVTVPYKIAVGQRYDHMTLRDTEAWQASFDVIYTALSFEIIATESKTKMLKKNYGKSILGLTRENIDFLSEKHFKPYLQNYFTNLISRRRGFSG